jgi:hypothetical protein
MYFYVDKKNQQVAMISQGKIEQTTFDEVQFPATDPVYVEYKQTGGNLYIRNNVLKLE